ncbi:hypothetical protein NQ318_019686 [Aromia moschata]|uniref:Uncharacterized protein n=1 Tax=Aromia moschata TaxID=1265417 RepID=A0AAV8Z5Y8_9CUCU|nr:hypothetical protein NQ318_019686 [Aromia moschata]
MTMVAMVANRKFSNNTPTIWLITGNLVPIGTFYERMKSKVSPLKPKLQEFFLNSTFKLSSGPKKYNFADSVGRCKQPCRAATET